MIRPRAECLRIRCRWILPIGRPALESGWIGISGGIVTSLGQGIPPGPFIDLEDAIIVPGFVNAHTHLEFSNLQSPLDTSGGLLAWIPRVVAMRRQRDPHTVCDAITKGIEESLAAGVTAIGDIVTTEYPTKKSTDPQIVCLQEVLGLSPLSASRIQTMRTRLASLRSAGYRVGISPHAPYSLSWTNSHSLCTEASKHSMVMAMHLGEGPLEEEFTKTSSGPWKDLLQHYDVWPLDRVVRLGTAADWIMRLSKAPRGMIVHGTFLDDVTLGQASRRRKTLCVVVCPRTTNRLSDRLPPIQRFLAAGLRVAIGTDSRASNPDLSILREIELLVSSGLVSPKQAISMATHNGAWALGLERTCGILAPGRPADVVVLQPEKKAGEPYSAIVDPSTIVRAVLRKGRLVSGSLD